MPLICLSCMLSDCEPTEPPIAAFTYSPPSPRVFESILFSASSSYDPDGFISRYSWDFGDGNTTWVSDFLIYHHYETPGVYKVTLEVIDSGWARNTTSKEITITATNPPLAVFTYSPLHPRTGQTVVFNASESKPNGGYIVSYSWNFGDNVTEATDDPIVTHAYITFANYSVALTITDSEGETATTLRNITLLRSPKADFVFEPLQPHVCDTITFDASKSVPNGGFITEFKWNFDDGSDVEFGIIVQHKYVKMGEYTVSLNITDSEGEWDLKEITFTVLPHRADLNEDGKVSISDLYMLCRAYASYPGHERWDAKADINHDGKVSLQDAVIIAKAFHQCEVE